MSAHWATMARGLAAAALFTVGMPGSLWAQVRTDGSVGAAVTLSGPSMLIPQTLGRQAGSNLFHSFSAFSIGAGESATFVTTAALTHVIARVTGTEPSSINGTLALTAPAGSAPALWLLNPQGILFGEGARLDLPGAFHAATADYVRLGSDRFHADLARASSFSSAPPEAFGFLGRGAAPLLVQGSTLSNGDRALGLIGGAVTFDGAGIRNAAGDVFVAAVGAAALEIAPAGVSNLALQGDLRLKGSTIATATQGAADGGSIGVQAGTIDLVASTILTQTQGQGRAGAVAVSAADTLQLGSGSRIGSQTFGAGGAGAVQVTAGQLTMDSLGVVDVDTAVISEADLGSTGAAGSLSVTVRGDLVLKGRAYISSSTYGDGDAGAVTVKAGSLRIDAGNIDYAAGIYSDSYQGAGNAGPISVDVAGLTEIVRGGLISSVTYAQGAGGLVSVRSGRMVIDGAGFAPGFTGIFAQTDSGDTGLATGSAGGVRVGVAQDLTLTDGAAISSSSLNGSSGHAGAVQVSVGGALSVLRGAEISSNTSGAGNAGTVTVAAASAVLDSQGLDRSDTTISSEAKAGSSGRGGSVSVEVADSLMLLGRAFISSSTYGDGDAGAVSVKAGSLRIDAGNIDYAAGIYSDTYQGAGNAGPITVDVARALNLVRGGLISSTTYAAGNAGSVDVHAGQMLIDGSGFAAGNTGIFAQAFGGSGNAGPIAVGVDSGLSVVGGGAISSSTQTAGAGGSVSVRAGRIELAGAGTAIGAQAQEGSSGQTGQVSVEAARLLSISDGAQISIANQAIVAADSALTAYPLTVTAPAIVIRNSADAITARSGGNIDADSIVINARDLLRLDQGSISTSANLGDGGAIDIQAGLMQMRQSQVSTSVLGTIGNGGDIGVQARSLVLRNGFIQANTAADHARGGDVRIALSNLVPEGGLLYLGGATDRLFATVFGYNVIQAASPTGVSGDVAVTVPTLDISGALARLSAAVLDTAGLGRSPCQRHEGSSFAIAGRGGVATIGPLAPSPLGRAPEARPRTDAQSQAREPDASVLARREAASVGTCL